MTSPTPSVDESSLFEKLRRHGRAAGEQVVVKSLELFLALRSPHTPRWARTVIAGALIYLISPADAAPDFLPGVGYVDDLGVILSALTAVASSVTPEIRAEARRQAGRWLGDTSRS